MTREQAIRELKIQFVGEYDRQREAKDMAIKALEQEPVIESAYKTGYELGRSITMIVKSEVEE